LDENLHFSACCCARVSACLTIVDNKNNILILYRIFDKLLTRTLPSRR
jgi:DNA-binding HxlR family transcriptional regulator